MFIIQLVSNLPEVISSAVEANQWIGYCTILLAMFLENLFPPIPSELIMPLGGFYVQQGQLNFLPVVLAGVLGTVLGAFPWYGIGRLVNEERLKTWIVKYGNFLGIRPEELDRSRRWFNRYGAALVFWGRLIPGIRTLISVPAGIELMPLTPFLIWTTAGSFIWTLFLTMAGFALGESYSNLELWIAPLSKLIKLLLVLGVISGSIFLVFRVKRKKE